ncbi:MAG TPA: type III PLP-dependent enzyme [Candidatus Saccharimonadales bacterium]|nr:type III PLP-dependent enzyme [Candidatus Saccharimonadales bacterium]
MPLKTTAAKPKATRKSRVVTPQRATPYMVTDLAVVRQSVRNFQTALPKVALHYAIKANRDPRVIRTINSMVDGYDIASLGELNILLSLGIKPDRILYSNPVKIPAHIKAAYKLGVRYFAFDSLTEIEKLAKYAPGSNVYLRLKVSDYGSLFPLSKKFGVGPLHGADFCSIAQEAGLKVKGVTFHVGSQSENVQVWETALEIAGKLIAHLADRGIQIEFLNLGGGFPADYGEPVAKLTDIAKTINKSVKKHIPAYVKLMAEPGRSLVASSTTLVTTVIGREHRSGSDWLYLDMGAFQGLIEPLEIPNLKYPVRTDKNPNGYEKSFVLTGPTCDAYDTIGTDYSLPSDISVGDKLYIDAVGAYTLVYASAFNGFEPPKNYFIN